MTDECVCVAEHSPKPVIVQHHHIVPICWVRDGGQPADPVMVPLCGTAHDSVHTLLNHYVRAGRQPSWEVRRHYSAYIRMLAETAWALRPNSRPPFTTTTGEASRP